MQLSIRAVFAACLWTAAAVPLVLMGAFSGSPEGAVAVAEGGARALRTLTLVAGLALAAGIVLYPPFLPAVRLGLHRMRSRLSTDLGALREAQARLQHFETAADHLTAGRVLREQGKVQEALPHLARAAELDPAHAATRYQLGLALSAAGALPAAMEQLATAVQLDEEHAFGAALLQLGVVLERGGADDRAVEVLERHRERYGASRQAQFHLARALWRRGDREAAAAALREVARPPADGERLDHEDALLRARARVAALRGGRP